MTQAIEDKYKMYRQAIADKIEGKILPKHDEDGHKYLFVDTGEVVRSVTTKIIVDRPHLVPWAVRVAFEWMESRWPAMNQTNRDGYLKGAQMASADVRDDAGSIGTLGHNAIEDYCNEWITTGVKPNDIRTFINPNADPRVFAIARSAEKIFNDRPQYRPLAVEILVGDEKLRSAGTLDALVMNMDDGNVELWDWKSSNDVHDTYAMQVGAYAHMFEGMTNLLIDDIKIAHLSKDYDKPVLHKIVNRTQAVDAFMSISRVFDYLYDNNQPIIIKDEKILEIKL